LVDAAAYQKIDVRLLGRIQVRVGGFEVDLGAAGPRSLFAVLALRANSTLSLAMLSDAIWGEAVPRSAEGTIYTYVSIRSTQLSSDSWAGVSARLSPHDRFWRQASATPRLPTQTPTAYAPCSRPMTKRSPAQVGNLSILADALRLAATRGFDEFATKLATALGVICHCTSRWADWLRIIEIGQVAAGRVNDRLSQGRLHNDSGLAYHFLGRVDEAIASHQAAIDILTTVGDDHDQAIAINLAVAYSMMGRHLGALPLLETAMGIARDQGNHFVEASVAGNLGVVLSTLGRHDEAIESGRRCVELFRALGSWHMLGHGLAEVGDSCVRAGHTEAAMLNYSEAWEVWRQLGDRWGEVRSMLALAKAHKQAGMTGAARQLLADALQILRETGYDAVNESEAVAIRSLLAEIG
jgi:tetratricopeptide (TPR) repeat protein